MSTACWPYVQGLCLCVCACALTLQCTATTLDRFFNVVDWERMLQRDYKPPMVPALAHDLDLSFFDPTFTMEPPYVLCAHLDLFWSRCYGV